MLYKPDGSPVRVALAHDHLNQKGGAELVLRVMSEMFPDAPIFTTVYDEKKIGDWFPKERIRASFLQNVPGAKRYLRYLLPMIKTGIESLDFKGYDLILSSASGLIKGIIPPTEALHVCYCHTPPRYLWTDTKRYFDGIKAFALAKRLGMAYAGHLRTWDFQAAQRVDRYVANSDCVRKRIAKFYRRDADVVHPPVDVASHPAPLPLSEIGDYFAMVTRLMPYKQTELAVRAFNRLHIPLKIIGTGDDYERLKAMARPNIEFLGYLSDEKRNDVLARARGFIHPQPDEDFGMALVDALAAGRPVIAFPGGGALESMVPGVTGEFFKRLSWEELADAVIRFDETKYDPAAIRAHAENFSRAAFERKLMATLEDAVRTYEW